MKLYSTALPENILRLMPGSERAKLGAAGRTASEAQHRYAKQQERKMHEEFEQWLGLHRDRLYWDHSRFGKKTTNRPGHPDFVIFSKGQVLAIEMKVPGNVLSEDQKAVHAWLRATGTEPHVCFEVKTAIELVREKLLSRPSLSE